MGNPPGPPAGFTTVDIARRYRVSEDKVRQWIARNELRAINTAAVLCGRPRWVIPPDALVEFEQRRMGGSPARLRQRQKRRGMTDYYPD